ncbi:hypothetical protein CK203_086046 [Vitis vinifera]|uniref:Uncharacterized protein n=1 Tax=Vitis vinifera TaxID=29760 RepID=A0A438D555_VITVI|nr:hypothetical protein CK203_086046 [Vitis vinifera]
MAETTKLCILALGTFPGNLSSKELKQISGCTKDHFARENDVCEISQTYKKGCEITSQQKVILAGLRSWLSSEILFTSSPCIPDLLMAKDFKASVLHVSELPIALPKIPYNSPQSRIALEFNPNTNLIEVDLLPSAVPTTASEDTHAHVDRLKHY